MNEYVKKMWSVSSVAQSCPTLCDPMGFPVHHQFPKPTQTHVHHIDDAIQPSHLLLSPSPLAFNLSQHQGLFKWVSSSHQVPEPAGKVDQVPRTCTAGLRKKLKQETTKMGSRGSDTSPRRDAVWHQLYSTSHIYAEKRERDKTVDIFSWLAYTSYKQSQEILRAWEWLPVIISYTR